jgi:N-methylhydantoinase B
MNAVVCINDGDTHNAPVEAAEAKYPMVVEEYALRQDSGGAGRFRGGLGVHKTVRFLGDLAFNSTIERTQCPPWGIYGGHDALPNKLAIRRADGNVEEFPNGKVSALRLGVGEAYIIDSGGGGGYGSPVERPPQDVQRDVREGYVSLGAARDRYGVVLDPTTLEIDRNATASLRADLQTASADNGSSYAG